NLTGEERCDGLDNDCDRQTDEGFDLATDIDNCGQCGRACRYDHAGASCVGGACRRGICDQGFWDVNRSPLDGCEYSCTVSQGGQEICDGEDNDCNGVVDDGFDTRHDPRHCGRCGFVCSLLGAVAFCNDGRCDILACEPGWQDVDGDAATGCECSLTNGGVEVCDGLDNDCNGTVDDNLGRPPVSCLGFGVCAGSAPRCDGESGWSCPYPDSYQAAETRCDGLDNDCNGLTDEGFPRKGEACAFGLGVCRGEGRMICNAAGDDLVCSEREHPERLVAEICDGLDNDCDGQTDEGSDAFVQLGDLLIYRYEASRTDARGGSPGTSFARACSTAGHLPWTNIDWETARTACARAEGAHLCTEEEWRLACAGAEGWAYPYHPTDYAPQSCNGLDLQVGRPLPAGSLLQCVTPAGVFDLSGNVWEWLDVDRSPGGDGSIRAFAGGSYGNIAQGLRCSFDVAASPATARDNIGFRCCKAAAGVP
ncbi:MAG: formylglycine-generating enzyme family protein, partial [Deltaproteobacteria bacterium]|nr:formylglycine-generating enzyme family protein [Deltaproteobacteria bacterium]